MRHPEGRADTKFAFVLTHERLQAQFQPVEHGSRELGELLAARYQRDSIALTRKHGATDPYLKIMDVPRHGGLSH
jgi:hypothetical protein